MNSVAYNSAYLDMGIGEQKQGGRSALDEGVSWRMVCRPEALINHLISLRKCGGWVSECLKRAGAMEVWPKGSILACKEPLSKIIIIKNSNFVLAGSNDWILFLLTFQLFQFFILCVYGNNMSSITSLDQLVKQPINSKTTRMKEILRMDITSCALLANLIFFFCVLFSHD